MLFGTKFVLSDDVAFPGGNFKKKKWQFLKKTKNSIEILKCAYSTKYVNPYTSKSHLTS